MTGLGLGVGFRAELVGFKAVIVLELVLTVEEELL